MMMMNKEDGRELLEVMVCSWHRLGDSLMVYIALKPIRLYTLHSDCFWMPYLGSSFNSTISCRACLNVCRLAPQPEGLVHSLDLFYNPGISAFERDPRGSAAGGSLDYALETPGLPLERQHGSSPTVLSFGDMWLVSLLQGRKWGHFWGIRAASALGPQPHLRVCG